MPVTSVIEAVREALREEMRRDPTVFILGEDVGQRGGVFLATQGFLEEFGRSRVIDTPLAEASIMGYRLGGRLPRIAPHPRNAVLRLHLALGKPVDRRGGASIVWNQRRCAGPRGHPSTIRRWCPRGPVPFPERRGLFLSHARPQGRRPVLLPTTPRDC